MLTNAKIIDLKFNINLATIILMITARIKIKKWAAHQISIEKTPEIMVTYAINPQQRINQ
ncbi:TPA: hypothetical protein ACPZB9_004589, partial [Yersinia enterocolitica]